MPMTFLEYYRENLAHLRSASAEFAAEFPKIAARLSLSEFECADPYVERLLEGAAFLAARVEKKIESGFPRMLESVLSCIAPAALYPTPSFCVLALKPSAPDALRGGAVVPAGTTFVCSVPGVSSPCIFSAQRETKLFPLALSEAEYCTRDLERFRFSEVAAASALRLKIERVGEASPENVPDELVFFLNLPATEASLLLEVLSCCSTGIYVGDGNRYERCADAGVDLPMFERSADDGFFSDAKTPRGLRTLQHFFAYPAAFRFFRVKGLRERLRRAEGKAAEIVIALTRRETEFIHRLERDNFKLWCVPAVNLFRKNTNRVELGGQYEYHIVPERAAPLDYEVYRVLSAEVYGDRNETLFRCGECFDATFDDGSGARGFFSAHRRDRIVGAARAARSSYPGTEVFLSFSGKVWNEFDDRARQFRAETLCTNRDLPLLVRANAILRPTGSSASGVEAAVFAAAPSRPLPALISRGREEDWMRAGHLAFNLSSALWRPGEVPVGVLKNLVRAYSSRSREETERLVEGIVELRAEPKTFRFIRRGCVFFEDGWSIRLTLNEQRCAGMGCFVFAVALRELIAGFTPLNSCAEIFVSTDRKEHVATWTL